MNEPFTKASPKDKTLGLKQKNKIPKKYLKDATTGR